MFSFTFERSFAGKKKLYFLYLDTIKCLFWWNRDQLCKNDVASVLLWLYHKPGERHIFICTRVSTRTWLITPPSLSSSRPAQTTDWDERPQTNTDTVTVKISPIHCTYTCTNWTDAFLMFLGPNLKLKKAVHLLSWRLNFVILYLWLLDLPMQLTFTKRLICILVFYSCFCSLYYLFFLSRGSGVEVQSIRRYCYTVWNKSLLTYKHIHVHKPTDRQTYTRCRSLLTQPQSLGRSLPLSRPLP